MKNQYRLRQHNLYQPGWFACISYLNHSVALPRQQLLQAATTDKTECYIISFVSRVTTAILFPLSLLFFFLISNLQYMPSGPTLWRSTSQEIPFPPSTRDLYGSHKCRKTKFHLKHCSFIISIHRMFSCVLTRFTGMFSIQRLTQPRWDRNIRLSITENTTACSKWFPFLDFPFLDCVKRSNDDRKRSNC